MKEFYSKKFDQIRSAGRRSLLRARKFHPLGGWWYLSFLGPLLGAQKTSGGRMMFLRIFEVDKSLMT